MRILVVDDEALARDRLKALVTQLGAPYEVIACANSGEEALEMFHHQGADLVLMDIRMPDMDGLEAAKRLAQTDMPPAVIFTTAYEEHALQAFETQAVDYLLKPVRSDRLAKALQSAQRLTKAQIRTLDMAQPATVPQLSINYRGGVQRLSLDQILFLRAESKYVTACYAEGEALLEESLKSLESRFPDWFMRIHRNALVARNALIGLIKDQQGVMRVRLAGCEEQLEVSRRHLPAVRRWLKDVD